jgi:nitrous oxidase accessory protein NosD
MSMLAFAFENQLVAHAGITITVPDDYLTIQEAINAASNGDTILVKAGVHVENVIVDKVVTLLGENKNSVIEGTIIFRAGALITGFKITGKIQVGDMGDYCPSFSDAAIVDNIIEKGGVQIGCDWGNIVYNVTVVNNTIKTCGVGISIGGFPMAPVATCFIKNNSILENDLGLHMKIGNPEPGLCVISTNLFYNNTNGLYLGGEGTCVVENNRIYLSAGFGIELSRESVRGDIFFNITGNHLWNNKYGINGSASYDLPRARGEAYDNTFEDNDYGVSLIARTNVEFGNMPWDFTLSHNNFLGNTQQVYVEIQGDIVIPSGIVWDKGYPVGGNWWSDYSGSDVDGDGIGDSPYVIDATDRDNYPLMHPYARAPVVEWQKTYSLPPARSCQQTSDGGYILTGGSTEVYLLKTDSDGVIEWQKTYPEGRLQQGYSVQQTYDGGYIIAVCGDPYDDTTDYTHLIKTASNGTIQWKKSFGIFRDVYSARQTIDGGYIVVGRWNDGSGGWPGFVTKLDSYANIQWTQWFDDGIDGYRLPCVELGEFVGEYIVGGKSTSDAALIKLGSSGNILWERPFAFENTYTELDALVLAGDGGYAFGGFADSGTLVTAYIAKTDSSGTVLWTKAVDSLGNSPYRGGVRSMDQTADGGFILAGSKGSSAALVKTEANGNKQWNMTFGEGLLTSVQTISDGYIACGSSGGSASLLKIRLISTLHFSDGFESGDFVAWPGTYVTSDETASVTNTLKHHDVFSALFSSNGGDGRERSYCYESIFPQLELYARAYVRVAASGIVENDDRFYLIIFNAGNSAVAFAGWRRTGGVLKWNLVIRNGTGWVNAFSSASPSLNQWYCVELHWKKDSTNGLGELWVDGVLVCSASGRNTASFGDANRVDVGLPEIISCASTQVYTDCIVISASPIGTEAGPSQVIVHLESAQDSGATSNLGSVTLDAVSYVLPNDVSKSLASFSVAYITAGAYLFDHWETSGGVSVASAISQTTTATVSGTGILRAVYRTPAASTIFEDGFESGNFNAWLIPSLTAGETRNVVSTFVHSGGYAGMFDSNGNGGTERAYVYKAVSPVGELYARAYVRVAASGIVDNTDRFFSIIFKAGGASVAFAGWQRTGGVVKWNLIVRHGTGWVSVFSSASPSLNQWYCVELHWKKDSTNGLGELWVDGVLVCSASGRNTASFGDANRVDVGLPEIISCASTQAYIDCTVFSAAYIGLESAAPAPVFADDFESGSFNAWTASSSTAGETANVVGTIVHYGAYAGRFASNGNGGTERAYCYKTISSQTELYVSGSFRVAASGLVEEGDRFYMVAIKSSSSVVAFAGWRITGGVVKWNLVVRHGTGWVNVYSSASPVLNQWYDIQLHWKSDAANGLGELYVNGVLACSSMGKNTANYGSATRVDFGLPELVNCGATEVYGDTCKVSVNPT